jgi:predicted ATPase
MIERIYIDNFRCFTNFEFVPKRLNLLLGANGSGKSALFEVITALVDVVVHSADTSDAFPSDSRTRWDSRDTQRVELDVRLDGQHFRHALVIQHDDEHGVATILRESVVGDGKTLFAYEDGNVHLHKNDGSKSVSFPLGGAKSFLSQIERRPETTELTKWLDFISDVWSIQLNTHTMTPTTRSEQPTLGRDGANFSSWYRHFAQENPDRLPSLGAALQSAIPGFQTLALVSAGERGRVRDLVARMSTGDKTYELYFNELSHGQRALIILYTLLEARGGEGCLLLDEPELHVGLAEIQPWLVELDSRFESQGQVFVASHNPEVVDYMAASDPFLFERPDGGPARVRPAMFDRESSISASGQLARGLDDVQ